jgi:hypothetical protein
VAFSSSANKFSLYVTFTIKSNKHKTRVAHRHGYQDKHKPTPQTPKEVGWQQLCGKEPTVA